MKRFLLISVFIAFLYCIPSPIYGQIEANLVQVSGIIPDTLKTNGRYAYLFVQYENQAKFVDSCLIRDNQYLLKGKIPFDEIMSEVVIDGVPASSGGFILSSGDHVNCDFEPLGRFIRAKALGSLSSEELFRVLNDSIKPQTSKLFSLFQRSRATDKSDPAYAILRDSISYYQQTIFKIWHRLLHTTNSGFNAIYAYMSIEPDLSPEDKKEIETSIIERFSDNINLSMITGRPLKGIALAEPTTESMYTFNRYATLTGEIPPYPNYLSKSAETPNTQDDEPEISISAPPQTPDKKQTVAISPPPAPKKSMPESYGVGDYIADFALPSMQNQLIELSQIESEYILIDIWASWCIPCRKEVPVIKAAVRKYGSRFQVFALSIDDNFYKWKNAIETDGIQMFTNVILRKDNPEFEKLRTLFDIKVIPRNFLLDKNRKVVAINLRGEELEQKLQELLPE